MAKEVTAVLAKNSLSMPSIIDLSSFKANISIKLCATCVKVSSASSIAIALPAFLLIPDIALPVVLAAKFKGDA